MIWFNFNEGWWSQRCENECWIREESGEMFAVASSVERRVEKWSREKSAKWRLGGKSCRKEGRNEAVSEWDENGWKERREKCWILFLLPFTAASLIHFVRSFFQTHSLCREYFSLLNFNSGARKTEGVFSEGTISLEIRALSFSKKFYLALFKISSHFSLQAKYFALKFLSKSLLH